MATPNPSATTPSLNADPASNTPTLHTQVPDTAQIVRKASKLLAYTSIEFQSGSLPFFQTRMGLLCDILHLKTWDVDGRLGDLESRKQELLDLGKQHGSYNIVNGFVGGNTEICKAKLRFWTFFYDVTATLYRVPKGKKTEAGDRMSIQQESPEKSLEEAMFDHMRGYVRRYHQALFSGLNPPGAGDVVEIWRQIFDHFGGTATAKSTEGVK